MAARTTTTTRNKVRGSTSSRKQGEGYKKRKRIWGRKGWTEDEAILGTPDEEGETEGEEATTVAGEAGQGKARQGQRRCRH